MNVRYTNKKNEDESMEKRFSFYRDFEGSETPTNAQLSAYIDEIFDRITQAFGRQLQGRIGLSEVRA